MSAPFLRPYPDLTEHAHGLSLRSPAKINLSLRVLGKRPDGYHALDTIFQELDWADMLDIAEADDFGLEVVGADLPVDNSNLITRAARLLAEEARRPCQARIRLDKVLPLRGGVGGGSSNAALTLLGLNRLWGLDWPISRLDELAGRLGADCPFFLYGGLARGTGRGDKITSLDGAIAGVILVVLPPFGVNTAWAFSQFRFPLTEVEKNVIFNPLLPTGMEGLHTPISACNDLENIVFRAHSELGAVRNCLLRGGASVSLLSGSGSSLFGIFESEQAAHVAARELPDIGNGWRYQVCQPVARPRQR
ncbi:MAG: 4-(cytidine 5'-diphospho)-2-C-methyl-D-erythritol kinase [bacterium]|nr:4-(cytidine 5'-diphospho)-2-C-methyl-D-erythritol kinase [bacterium]